MDRIPFRTTPLFRLQATYMEDLDTACDPELEAKLVDRLRDRLAEAEAKRDANFKGLFLLDACLAIALSGKGFTIPVVNLSTLEFPALMEILVGLSSVAICITSLSFTTWLTYSSLLTATLGRNKSKDTHGRLVADADHFNEVGLRLFERYLGLGVEELLEPGKPFLWTIKIYEAATSTLFALIPVMHGLLVAYGLLAIYDKAGFGLLHTLLFVTVFIGHLLATLFWFAPTKEFAFSLLSEKPKATCAGKSS